jgi:hypothetical protein
MGHLVGGFCSERVTRRGCGGLRVRIVSEVQEAGEKRCVDRMVGGKEVGVRPNFGDNGISIGRRGDE